MTEFLYLLTICLPLGTLLIIFSMKYVTAILQARVRLEDDAAYRQIAARAMQLEAATATSLASIEAALAETRLRLTAIEKILKEVG
jgi:hypothetical protein